MDNKYSSISFIILSFNQCDNIIKIINSIKYAKLKNYEIIVIDNNSNDNTQHIIKQYCEKNCIPYKFIINNIPKNQSRSRNIGLNIAKKEYIYYIDGDDCLNSIFLHNIQYNLNSDVVFVPRIFKELNDKIYEIRKVDINKNILYTSVVQGFYNRKQLLKYNIKHNEDKFFYYTEDLIFTIQLLNNIYNNKLTYHNYTDHKYCYYGIKTKTSTKPLNNNDSIIYYTDMYQYIISKYNLHINVKNFLQKEILKYMI